jgi:hypothetical protein
MNDTEIASKKFPGLRAAYVKGWLYQLMNIRMLLTLLLVILQFNAVADTDEKSRNRLKNLYGESDIYEHFFYELKNALIAKDAEKIASLNHYPIRVNFDNGTKYYKSKDEFIASYDKIVTEEMLERVKKQSFSTLFANSYGMHIGFGDIWFAGYCVGDNSDNPCEKVRINVAAYNVNSMKK